MQNLLNNLTTLLSKEEKYLSEGRFLKNVITEDALKLETSLLKLLLSDSKIKKHFFQDVEGTFVFDKIKFQKFISNKQFLPDSYTTFRNKIGLTVGDEYISEKKDVVLSWPYKDCLLEGGQDKEDAKRDEIFWNEILAPDEIDRLLSPKVLSNWKKYDKNGEHEVQNISDSNNLIIKGNNLLGLSTLLKYYRGKVKLIYIDPPYNTGNDSFKYNDNFNHSTWLTFMKNRLTIAKELLRKDGVIFVQCDDNEQAYLKVLMDEVFERENFINLITVKTKIAGVSGSSEGNSLQDNCEYLNLFAKNKNYFKIEKVITDKMELFDFIENFKTEGKSWKYTTVLEEVDDGEYFKSIDAGNGEEIKIFKHKNYSFKSINQTAKEKYDGDLKKTYYGEINKIFRTTNAQSSIRKRIIDEQIDGELISIEYVPIKGRNKGRITKLYYKDEIRNLITFLSDVVSIEKDKIYKLEKKGTLWDTINYNNIARDGGVKFENGKKPEELLKLIVDLATKEDDIILDYHLGSGTTTAVAHKMHRKYIGIEQLDYGKNDSVQRQKNVINGDSSGISKEVNWKGGGSFLYCELAKANQGYVDKINKAEDAKELKQILRIMLEKAFISYNVDIKSINENIAEFVSLPIEDQKRFLIEVLDKNMLYVPYSEIDDVDYQICEMDKKLNHMFYGGKK